MEEAIATLAINNKLTPEQLIKNFRYAQTARVYAYNKFEVGFKEYLATNTFEQFQQLTQTITVEFVSISNKIREIENDLNILKRSDLANIIRDIQNNEKEKLRLTAAIQVYRKSEKDLLEEEKFIEPMLQQEKKEYSQLLAKIINKINDLLEELKYAIDEEQ